MKVYQHRFCVLFSLFAAISGAACSTTPTTPINGNSNTALVVNSNVANTKSVTNTVATAVPPANVSPTQNAAGSPNTIVAAYYQSMVKKDEKGFRQVLSKTTLTELSADARAEGEKNLVEYWTGYSSPPKQPYETRNERISGDVALVEVKDGDTGRWSLTKLVRENGEWKLDLTSATVESLLKQQPKQ